MSDRLLGALFSLPRHQKRILQLLADTFLLAGSFALAMLLRTGEWAHLSLPLVWAAVLPALPVTLLVFQRLGFYRAVIRYMEPRAVLTIVKGVVFSTAMVLLTIIWLDLPVPATVPVIYAILALCSVGGVRFALRAIYQRTHSRDKIRVIIYGAGQSGRQTVHSLKQGQDYAPVAFVDDNQDLWGVQIIGLRVFAPHELDRLIRDYGAKVLLLAVPSASRAVRAGILKRLEQLPIRIQTIPGMVELIAGTHRFAEPTEIAIEDLLGRDSVPPDPQLLAANTTGRAVMVTGAGGSIGSELCRQILLQLPRQLIMVEQSEFALFELTQELAQRHGSLLQNIRLTPVLASVRDQTRMTALMRQNKVETVYHAAAYKHVPLVEENPAEGVLNNVFGTLATARAAAAVGVRSFTLVSTDKAVRPTSVMGASKRLAELVCQALAIQPGPTCYSMVRFGNVLGSSGSVIPLFRRQIASGGPVTVTHPEIMRYFMTAPEAAQLVIQAGAMAHGGDVFLLDMGEPVRIVELAERMIRLAGRIPVLAGTTPPTSAGSANTVPIIFTSPRRGEKLFEELFIGTISEPTDHPRILTATETALDWARLQPLLDELYAACTQHDAVAITKVLSRAPLDYNPRRAGVPFVLTDFTTAAPTAPAATYNTTPATRLPSTPGQVPG